MKSLKSYIFQSAQHSDTQIDEIKSLYNTGMQKKKSEKTKKKKKRRRDGMMSYYLVMACFVVLLLEDELGWDKVGEFDTLLVDA